MSDPNSQLIADCLRANLALVRAGVQAACDRAGRTAADVKIVAVTKSVGPAVIAEVPGIGLLELAENRPQQLLERAGELATSVGHDFRVRWHLIGQLQRNKVRAVLPVIALLHSVDSLRLLERVSQVAGELSLQTEVLLQVNTSGEASKQGFSVSELRQQWPVLCALPNVQLRGLMTMAPDTEDETVVRSTFRALRELRDELRSESGAEGFSELSMGMSQDYEIAIEEGATIVRLGSTLFQGLPSGVEA